MSRSWRRRRGAQSTNRSQIGQVTVKVCAASGADEVKEQLDASVAMQAYARQAKNRQLEIDAAEIRMRAERRLGEMIRIQKETVGLARGKRTDLLPKREEVVTKLLTLEEVGIDKPPAGGPTGLCRQLIAVRKAFLI